MRPWSLRLRRHEDKWQVRLACQLLVKDFDSPEITLEPLPTFEVIKDLIVDIKPFLERVRQMRPYLQTLEPAPQAERLQDPDDSKKLAEAIRCILCASCVGACPVSNENPEFMGPAPLVWAFRLVFDSRDQKTKERLEQINNPNGAWGCENHFECTRVCPKEIKVTKHINMLKKRIEKELGATGAQA
jgi:succinate dehydrogenase / fumarate reductase iron-sulfur subunit